MGIFVNECRLFAILIWKEDNVVGTLVKIEVVRDSNDREFLVRDKDNINFARFFILEMDKSKKHVLIRLKTRRFVADAELEELLSKIFLSFTRKGEYFKVAFITSEDINIRPFTRLGFVLEGVLQDNVYIASEIRDEYIFGATSVTFRLTRNEKLLNIHGERIDLRLTTPDEAEIYLNYQLSNKDFLEVYEPLREDKFYTMEGQKEELKARYQQYLNGSSISFGIFYKEVLVGKIRISNIVFGSFKGANIGYALHRDYLNRGLMSEAVDMVLDYAFHTMGLHRIEASTLTDNLASQRVLGNNGFKQLGLNEKYLLINGEWRDHFTFYITKESYVEKAHEAKTASG